MSAGNVVRLTLAAFAALAGCAWALTGLVAGHAFTAAMQFILACVLAEVLAPRRQRAKRANN